MSSINFSTEQFNIILSALSASTIPSADGATSAEKEEVMRKIQMHLTSLPNSPPPSQATPATATPILRYRPTSSTSSYILPLRVRGGRMKNPRPISSCSSNVSPNHLGSPSCSTSLSPSPSRSASPWQSDADADATTVVGKGSVSSLSESEGISESETEAEDDWSPGRKRRKEVGTYRKCAKRKYKHGEDRRLAKEATVPKGVKISRESVSRPKSKKKGEWGERKHPPAPRAVVRTLSCEAILSRMSVVPLLCGGDSWARNIISELETLYNDIHPEQPKTLTDADLPYLSAAATSAEQQSFSATMRCILLSMHVYFKAQLQLIGTRKKNANVEDFKKDFLGRPEKEFAEFCRHYTKGGRYWLLAAGGTLCILPLLISSDSMSIIHDTSESVISDLVDILRSPDPDLPSGRLVLNYIIPAVFTLRECMTRIVQTHAYFGGEEFQIYFNEIDRIDSLYSNFCTYNFTLIGRHQAWIPPVAPSLQFEPYNPEDFPVHIIHTNFDPSLHASLPFAESEAETWTSSERVKAENGIVVRSLNELKEALKTLYPNGKRSDDGQYVVIDYSAFESAHYLILDKNGKELVWFSTTYPQERRSLVTDAVLCSLPSGILHLASKSLGQQQFAAFHFFTFNRYHLNGKSCPSGINPRLATRAGMRTNMRQALPYVSAHKLLHLETSVAFEKAVKPWIEYLSPVMDVLVPDQLQLQRDGAGPLPDNPEIPFDPFMDVTANANGATVAHRDDNDLGHSATTSFTRQSGGDLVLYEPGLVLKARPLDISGFSACNQTHFNLLYDGVRVSAVFSNDRNMKHFNDGLNGYDHHIVTPDKGPLFLEKISRCI